MELEDSQTGRTGRPALRLAVSSVHALAFILMVTVGLVMLVTVSAVFGFAVLFIGAAAGWQWSVVVLLIPGVIFYIVDRVFDERD